MAVKKDWYEIIAPKFLGNHVVGETLTGNPKTLKGRTVEVSMMDINNDFSKFYIKLKLQVTEVDGKKLYTRFIGHDILKEKIYRMVLRRRRRVDSIDLVRTKDGKTIRIKTITIILRRTKTSIKEAVRKKISEMIRDVAEKNTMEELVKSILSGSLQKSIRDQLKKIYPVGEVEIRKSEIIENVKNRHKKLTESNHLTKSEKGKEEVEISSQTKSSQTTENKAESKTR
ncbi:MAG: 30S ribosomal protein S3ae [Candidatus Aenigmarchaeota archaeon]|nr:30S ribosomal protein S3ae [Candidatus Aenigmarchaeota archaeon]